MKIVTFQMFLITVKLQSIIGIILTSGHTKIDLFTIKMNHVIIKHQRKQVFYMLNISWIFFAGYFKVISFLVLWLWILAKNWMDWKYVDIFLRTLLIPGILPIMCLIVLNTKIYHYITGLKSALQSKEGRIVKQLHHMEVSY